MEVVRLKVEGVTLTGPAPAAKGPGKVVDLMEVLKQSLIETQKKGGTPRAAETVETAGGEETVAAGGGRSRSGKSRKAR